MERCCYLTRDTKQGLYHGYTILRDYIETRRSLREKRVQSASKPPQAYRCRTTGVSYNSGGGETAKSLLRCRYSGIFPRFHFWCTDSSDAEHTYEGMIRSFEHFGGVPKEVLVDNQEKYRHRTPCQSAVHFNERFLDLAGHYGLPHGPVVPEAQTKGRMNEW